MIPSQRMSELEKKSWEHEARENRWFLVCVHLEMVDSDSLTPE